MNFLCLKCKGKNLCGKNPCPKTIKFNSLNKIKSLSLNKDFISNSKTPFVGWNNYPNVNVGILVSQDNINNSSNNYLKNNNYNSPKYLFENNFNIQEIVDFRSSILNSNFKHNIQTKNKTKKLIEISKEITLSTKPVDLEINLKDKPKINTNFDDITIPIGIKGELQKANIISNSKINSKVDKVYSDTDLKATDAMNYLYKSGFDETFLSNNLSIGNFGQQITRKIVPTRWAITAVDDNLGKNLIQNIKDNKIIDEYYAYFSEYLGNYYLILLFPEEWSYELFETIANTNSNYNNIEINYTTDYENIFGRREYAKNCAGGYYTTRLAIVEKLNETNKKSSALAIRIITQDYSLPLGVWVTREASRKTMNQKPLKFSSKELILKYAEILIKKKFNLNIKKIIKESKLLKEMKTQKTLLNF
jgi:DNA repair protein NreA